MGYMMITLIYMVTSCHTGRSGECVVGAWSANMQFEQGYVVVARIVDAVIKAKSQEYIRKKRRLPTCICMIC